MTERRYGDEEVREIFSLATTAGAPDASAPAEADGLTLADLQRIGQEAGIEPVRVALAAEKLDARGQTAPVRRSLGFPIGVSRVVRLPRAVSDREWEQLVSHFRTVCDAQGRVRTTGGLREWSHAGMCISMEPTENGEQLRFTARNESATALNGFGIITGSMAMLMSAVVASAGKLVGAIAVFGTFGGMALAGFGTNLIRSPRWAREREREMEEIAEHAVKLLSDP